MTDYSKPIQVPDECLTWPGKSEGAPRPSIIWASARRISTEDLAWLIVAYEQFPGYAPFKAETISALRELYERRQADGDNDDR